MTIPDFTDNYEAGALARARAVACDVPDPGMVVRVTFDGQPVFHYDDGREPFVLPPLTDTTGESL